MGHGSWFSCRLFNESSRTSQINASLLTEGAGAVLGVSCLLAEGRGAQWALHMCSEAEDLGVTWVGTGLIHVPGGSGKQTSFPLPWRNLPTPTDVSQ